MKVKSFLGSVIFIILSVLIFTSCGKSAFEIGNSTASTTGTASATGTTFTASAPPSAGAPHPETFNLSGYVYAPAAEQGKQFQKQLIQTKSTGLLVSNTQLNYSNYMPVAGATIKREDNPDNPISTNSQGFFSFSNLKVGQYNIMVDPSTSSNAANYSPVVENFEVHNPVTSQSIISLTVVPVKTTVPLGLKRQFRVIAKDINANPIPPPEVSWSVTDGIGEINQNGIFTASQAGEGQVIATYGSISSYSIVTVIGGNIGQNTGILEGTVSDGTIPLEGITIKVEGISSIGLTDADGFYSIPEIPSGIYNVYAYENEDILAQQQVRINAGKTTQANFTITHPSTSLSTWQKCFGGSSNDSANSIKQTSDGGYIVAGNIGSSNLGYHGGMYDYGVLKLNSSGVIQWQKCLGGSDVERAYSIEQTSDGGYILAGDTTSNNGDVSGNHGSNGSTDVWVVKLDSSGVIKWQKCLGGSDMERAYSIQQTSDGGYILAGETNSNNGDVLGNHGSNGNTDVWVVKLDSSGVIKWQKCLGGSDIDIAFSIKQTSDGGYILAGDTTSNNGDVSGNHGNMDFWVLKLNSSGVIQWQKCLGGSDVERAYSIEQTSDGGYIVAGYTISRDGDVSGIHRAADYFIATDAWVVKLNSSGVIQWQKCLGGNLTEVANSIQQTSEGGYITAGYTNSNDGDVSGKHGSTDFWVVKLNSRGVIQWQKCFGGSDIDIANAISQTSEGGYITAGFANSNDGDVSGNHGRMDFWVVKFSSL